MKMNYPDERRLNKATLRYTSRWLHRRRSSYNRYLLLKRQLGNVFNLSLHKTKRAACNLCSPAQQCTDFIQTESVYDSDGGIMVSIAAFQAVDPGSIPGRRIFFFTRNNLNPIWLSGDANPGHCGESQFCRSSDHIKWPCLKLPSFPTCLRGAIG